MPILRGRLRPAQEMRVLNTCVSPSGAQVAGTGFAAVARMNDDLCACGSLHEHRRIVVTGGPGAGKTAVLEIVRRSFCQHVRVLPEAASLLFGGGFPREDAVESRKAAQRAIFYVQRELERLVCPEDAPSTILCDRGTLDGLAYWPGKGEDMLRELGVKREAEMRRYDVVIHLRTPSERLGYNHQNLQRLEDARAAAEVDRRIATAWQDHPHRVFVDSAPDFTVKVMNALRVIADELPACCAHPRVVEEPRARA